MTDIVSTTTNEVLTEIERGLDGGGTQTGIRRTITTTNTHDIGNRVVDVSLAPYARTRWIVVTLENMRHNTDYIRMYWGESDALDQLNTEISFSDYVNESGESIGLTQNWDQYKGSTIINASNNEIIQFVKTDANGFARFAVRVPKNTHIGDSVLEAIYEGNIYAASGGRDTRANAIYRAHGINQTMEPTILTTQTIDTRDSWSPPTPPEPPPNNPPPPARLRCGSRLTEAQLAEAGGAQAIISELETVRTQVRVTPDISVSPVEYIINCINRGGVDPLAQSFTTFNEPVYISSIDLFFQTKPSESTGPAVTLELREMLNGYPGPKIIPGSTLTYNPSQINVSTDASVKTSFRFQDPVYLEGNTNYCFVILAFSTEYELWASELGQADIITGNIIERQPVLGSLFTSQNNITWTPEQNFDLKFNLNNCNFSSDGVNEYINLKPMTGSDAYNLIQKTSQLTLGTSQIVHPNTDIRWYYKYDQTTEGPTSVSQGLTSEWRLFKPGVNLDLQNLTSQVLLRMEFSGGTLSPVIDKERAGIIFLKNLNSGVYITRTVPFTSISPSNLRPNRVRGLITYRAPTNTVISIYMAINQDVENQSDIKWRKVVDITGSGGEVESGSTSFIVDTITDGLILDSPTGFYTGQAITFSGLTGAVELTGTKYVRPIANNLVLVYNSESDAINDTGNINISAGSGTLIRSSFARYNESELPGGWTEAQFDYDFNGVLNLQQGEGIDQFKFKIGLSVDEGFEAKTPLVKQLRLIAARR
jgi:hypothetical protein